MSQAAVFSRRQTLVLATGLVSAASTANARSKKSSIATRLMKLEHQSGGRLGVCVLNTETGIMAGYRMHERFGMCSTFKLLLAGIILREGDAGRIKLDEWQAFSEDDLKMARADTRDKLDKGGMTMAALAETAQKTSDNAAANMLLRKLGGPAGMTQLLRGIGDDVTRLDRFEPDMNLVLPGDERDTTTPLAMAKTTAQFLTGKLLTPQSREKLIAWMVATQTGTKRLLAGLPTGWRAGDKTGTGIADANLGMVNKYNDVAIVFPPRQPPVIIAAYFDADAHYDDMRDQDQAVLADVGRSAASWIVPE